MKNLIKAPVKYEPMGQTILDADSNRVCDIRGWGRICYMEEPEEKQDAMGQFIADAINEKLEHDSPEVVDCPPDREISQVILSMLDEIAELSDPFPSIIEDIKPMEELYLIIHPDNIKLIRAMFGRDRFEFTRPIAKISPIKSAPRITKHRIKQPGTLPRGNRTK